MQDVVERVVFPRKFLHRPVAKKIDYIVQLTLDFVTKIT